jgi:hypothetical protein
MTAAAFVGIGGEEFELGEGLTPRVAAGLDAFVATVTRTLMCEGPVRCA